MSDLVIGYTRFTDGSTRPVYADNDRQYVQDGSTRVYGIWLIPPEDRCDAPVIVEHREGDSRTARLLDRLDGALEQMATLAFGPQPLGYRPAPTLRAKLLVLVLFIVLMTFGLIACW